MAGTSLNYEQWVSIYCECGHHANVRLPEGPWRHRDWILPRARCTACGKRGAKDMRAALAPDQTPGSPGYRASSPGWPLKSDTSS